MWADWLWMSRFYGAQRPQGGIPESASLYPDWESLKSQRVEFDAEIMRWAEALSPNWPAGEQAPRADRLPRLRSARFVDRRDHRPGRHASARVWFVSVWNLDISRFWEVGFTPSMVLTYSGQSLNRAFVA